MKNILLVAAREFRQIARMRSFWLTLLIVPVALAVAPIAQRFMDAEEADRIVVIDRAGGTTAKAIADRLRIEHQRDVLDALSRYVERHKLEAADPAAPWARHDRWYSDEEVRAFASSGGVAAARRKLEARVPDDIPSFEPPPADYEVVDSPGDLASLDPQALDKRVEGLLRPEDPASEAIDYVLLIPENFGPNPNVRLWSNRSPGPYLMSQVQDVLTRDLRTRFLTSQGLSPRAAAMASTIGPAMSITRPPPGGGVREALLVRSIVPLALAYVLMMSLILSGSWMLQGTVEERSNKLLETVLSSVSPEELMYGKMLGILAIGLVMIGVWVGCAGIAAYASQGLIGDFIRPALAPLNTIGSIATMIYFFIAGYIAISVFFLAIGAISDSMNEAQGFLMPVLFLILIPVSLLMQGVLAERESGLVSILTWIPIWTPFAILARMGLGIPTWEVIGAGVLMAAFIALEMVLLGRLFRASLLAQGQRPNLRELVARLGRSPRI